MKKILFVIVIIVAGIIIVGALSNKKNGSGTTNQGGSGKHPDGRTLSIDLTVGDKGFETSFNAAKEIGVQAVSFTALWDELEPSPGKFDPLYYAQASDLFSKEEMSATAGINTIDTFALRTPSDLRGKKFNDPVVIERYKKAVDFYLSQIKNKDMIMSFVVGNEIDGYLGTNQARWNEYGEFYRAVAPYIKSKLPNAVVGSKIMHINLTGGLKTQAQKFNEDTDVVMATYYPLNNDFTVKPPSVVRADVDAVMKLYPNKPVYFLEFGYPSSTILGSSEEKQVEFIREMFLAWDAYASRIPIITFFGMSDLTKADIDKYVQYYNVPQNKRNFGEYLGTLGLMKADGTHKKSFAAFQEEAKARGW